MTDLKDILVKTLTIVGYEEDKERFSEEFLLACYKEGYMTLLNRLPKEALQELNETVTMENLDQDHINPVVKKYLSKQDIEEHLADTAAQRVLHFMEMHMSSGDEKVKDRITDMLRSMQDDSK